MYKIIISIFFIAFFTLHSSAQQDTTTPDGLFAAARKAAFEEKNYITATYYCKKALAISPTYTDIRILLGSIYTWRALPDSARLSFQQAINADPTIKDAYIAYTNLEYWENNYNRALEICLAGLKIHPQSAELLLQKAKILSTLQQYKASVETLHQLLKIDKKNTEARTLMNRINDKAALNKLSISYDFDRFDKQFADPWHLVNIAYNRQTKFGAIGGGVNYASRFSKSGVQFEIEAYPKISKTFYSYFGAGYSPDNNVFPSYRAGFSLYANLPKSFEAEAGIRYLYFGNPTWVYTVAAGKYYRSWLFGTRVYFLPVNSGSSQSYNVTARHYFAGADDFFALLLGTGVSPDDRQNNILLTQNFKSYKVAASYRWSVKKFNIFTINTGWENREYILGVRGNQFTAGIAYIRKF